MRIIGHLDMDAFFAAVEERDHEWLRGLPVVVGADPQNGRGRGVVSTANYKAREYGIRSALPISQAWQFSEAVKKQGKPAAVFLGPSFERYEEVSENIMKIVRRYVEEASPPKFSKGKFERASIDEAYFDLSQAGSYEKAREMAQSLKKEIVAREHLTASIGIGPNKLIAKIASDMQKPDGLTIVEEKDMEVFFEPLPIRKIPGIGPKTEALFYKNGIRLVRDLKKFSREELEEMLGKWGAELYDKIRGQDNSPITEEYEVKSVGEQETFPEDTLDSNFIFPRLSALCAGVMTRLKGGGFTSFKTIVLTVRFTGFDTKTRSHTLTNAVNSLATLRFEALKLLMPFLDARENPRKKPIRLIGVRIEKLV